ncbi:MAG: SsrA-binding protein SmpB [Chloroflexi bacterium]|jgi:SsrA-binding protein|nr:SsrA-binding protein SmpB [Chloroflexota bacterium]MBT7080390.1 SsrA-binding protein SmpB [Chloroflexota bacterium]MBT7289441.1 SsrA-binding protein SmpB [Chloroflexota bacterium]
MSIKVISNNRKAFYDYNILERIEAGLVLTGTEIKSIREGTVNIRDAYVRPDDNEMWLYSAHISHYDKGNRYNHEPSRPRKLLLHRREIRNLTAKVREKGLTIVVLKLYIKGGVAKIEVGLAKGKKVYDKRQSIAKRDSDRDMARTLRRPR